MNHLNIVEHHDALLRLDFHRNHCFPTIDNSIGHGCCLVFDRVRGKLARTGLASAKMGHKGAKGFNIVK